MRVTPSAKLLMKDSPSHHAPHELIDGGRALWDGRKSASEAWDVPVPPLK